MARADTLIENVGTSLTATRSRGLASKSIPLVLPLRGPLRSLFLDYKQVSKVLGTNARRYDTTWLWLVCPRLSHCGRMDPIHSSMPD